MCATAVYETTKLIRYPRMSVVQSHIITIIFAGCFGFCISFIFRRRDQIVEQELVRLAAIVQHSDDAIMSTELDGSSTIRLMSAKSNGGNQATLIADCPKESTRGLPLLS